MLMTVKNDSKKIEIQKQNKLIFRRFLIDVGIPALMFLSAILVATFNLASAAEQISGKARVIDGDSLVIKGEKIRLHGIDAPELKQTCQTNKGKKQLCGKMAKQSLQRLIKNQKVTCLGNSRDKYKRLLATCYVEPFNINKKMVTDGWALAYRKYSKDYIDEEHEAKHAKVGMWRWEFVKPWEWRSVKRKLE